MATQYDLDYVLSGSCGYYWFGVGPPQPSRAASVLLIIDLQVSELCLVYF